MHVHLCFKCVGVYVRMSLSVCVCVCVCVCLSCKCLQSPHNKVDIIIRTCNIIEKCLAIQHGFQST